MTQMVLLLSMLRAGKGQVNVVHFIVFRRIKVYHIVLFHCVWYGFAFFLLFRS